MENPGLIDNLFTLLMLIVLQHDDPMYEVLGLFILFVVGIMLLTESGHLAHMKLFGNEIFAMTKTTFYFVIGVLVLSDIVQSRYPRKIQKIHAGRSL